MTTKKLARELGLIRKHSQSSNGQKNPVRTKQMFSYLIVIDFESTCWREKNNYGQEIIEFPAVLLNTTNGEIESHFHSFVQPQEHPVLSEFCTELTGITQKQVEAGLPLRICLSRFTRWLQTLQQEKGVVYVTDSKTTPPSGHCCAFLTWSDWDLGVCLLYECKRKQIVKPEVLNNWIDLRATYRTFYSRKPKGLNGALQDLGIQFSGREHSGLDDARNTARLAWRMVMDGCVLKVTKSLNRALVTSRPRFGEGCVHSEGSSKTHPPMDENLPPPFSSHSNESSTGNPNTGASSGVCQNLVPTCTILTSLVTAGCVNTLPLHTTLQNTTVTKATVSETASCDWMEGFLVTEGGESGSYDDVVLEEEDWGIKEGDESMLPSNAYTVNLPHTEVIRPHPPHSQKAKLRLSTPDPTSISPLPLPASYRSLGHLEHRTPSMPFTIYSDQLHQTSSSKSARGLFKVPHPVCLLTVNQSNRTSISTNQLPLNSATQSNFTSIFINQSGATYSPNQNRPEKTSITKKQSPSTSVSQSKRFTTFANQSALSSISMNQSVASCSNNQSECFSMSNHQSVSPSIADDQLKLSSVSSSESRLSASSDTQSALHSISTNQSWAASSTNQLECSSVSSNQSVQSALFSHSTNQSHLSSTINQSVRSSCHTHQSKLYSSLINQSALSSPCPGRRPLPSCRSDGENSSVTRLTKLTKVTAPLCACGRRAKRLVVCNGGPNHGRAFYSCQVRKSGPDPAHRGGCGFFKWESAVLNSLKPNGRISFSVQAKAFRNFR